MQVTEAHSRGEGDSTCPVSPHGGCTREQREKPGSGGGGFVATRGCGHPSSHWRMQLNDSAGGREEKSTRWRTVGVGAASLNGRWGTFPAEGGAVWREALSSVRPLGSWEAPRSRPHLILRVQFGPYPGEVRRGGSHGQEGSPLGCEVLEASRSGWH